MTSFRQIEAKLAKILIEQKNYATLYLRGDEAKARCTAIGSFSMTASKIGASAVGAATALLPSMNCRHVQTESSLPGVHQHPPWHRSTATRPAIICCSRDP
jgi:hypothetical protein